MKKTLLILVVLCFGFATLLSAGGGNQSNNRAQRVAGIVFQEDQFMRLVQMGYEDAAKAAGYQFFPSNTNGDAAREFDLLNTYLTQGFAGIAIAPISEEASLRVLQGFAGQGLRIGISNAEFESASFTGSFTSDNYNLGTQVGQAAAKYIRENLGGNARIALLQFKSLLPEQSSARSQGFLDQLKDLPGVTVVTDQDAWLQDRAIAVAGDIITANPDIDIIFAANEGGTIGATMAVKNAGKEGSIVVFGFDGSEQIVQLLQDPANVLQAAIAQDPYQIGIKTMESVINAINNNGQSSTQGEVVVIPGILLERSNPTGLQNFIADLRSKMGN